MSDTDWATLTASTNYYQNTYEASCCSDQSAWNNQDFVAWQTESYNIATTLYDGKSPDCPNHTIGVTENVAVPQAYLDKNTPIIQSRIVLGGYRLYALIRYIFDPAAPAPELFLN